VKVQIERVLDGTAYATLADGHKPDEGPITAEREAEKPTRAPAKKPTPSPAEKPTAKAEEEATEEAQPKKKTRRGSRGGRGRKRKATTTAAATSGNGAGEAQQVAKIHVPDPSLGEEADDVEAPVAEDGAEEPKPKRKTRRGSRGGRNRRKKTTRTPEQSEATTEWEYVPMSEWEDDALSE
jgi:ribonuclease E